MRIVFDTNILVQDLRLKGALFRVLFDSLLKISNTLHVPEVVLDEAVNKYRRRLEAVVSTMSSSVEDASWLLGRKLHTQLKHDDVLDETRKYKEWLERQLKSNHAEILPYPKKTHKDVVTRLLANRRPFNRGESGYRDYLIWETVLGLAVSSKDDIAFVSANTKDFLDEQCAGLHPDLLMDIKSLGIAESKLTYYRGLNNLIDSAITPTLKKLNSIAKQLNANAFPGLNFSKWLEDNLVGILDGSMIEKGPYSEAVLRETVNLESVLVSEVSQLSSGEVFVEVEVKFVGNFECYINKSDYYSGDHQGVVVTDSNWNDHVMQVVVESPIEVYLGLTLNLDNQKITSSDVWEINT